MCASNACLTDTLTLLFMDRYITWRNSILDIILNKTCVLKKEKTVVPMCYILSELSALLTHLLAVMHGPYLHLLKPFFFFIHSSLDTVRLYLRTPTLLHCKNSPLLISDSPWALYRVFKSKCYSNGERYTYSVIHTSKAARYFFCRSI